MPDPFQYRGEHHAPSVATTDAPNYAEGSQANLSSDLAGALRVTLTGGGGTASAFGDPFPADGTAIGIERGGNMVALVEGQAVMANSVPVVIASDQSAIPVTSSVPTSNTATDPTQTTVGTSAATALAAGTRKAMSIQNQGTTIIYVLLGAGTPTSSKYTVALPACGTANDGSSAPYTGPPGVVWTGAVQWISSAGGGLATAVELT